VCSPAVGDHRIVALDRVLVAEARASQVDAAHVYDETVVEPRRLEVADVRLEDDCLQPEVSQALVPTGRLLEMLDARDLEPDEVVRVVRDPLRVGFREADANICLEGESAHAAAMLAEPPWAVSL
jgi:hypothetical protein